MTKLTALYLICLAISPTITSSEILPFSINTKKLSHTLDDHFISITVNPTDILQGKVYGLAMNSTRAILKGLAPAYVRIGSADTSKYTFKRNRYPSDMVKPDDEYTVTVPGLLRCVKTEKISRRFCQPWYLLALSADARVGETFAKSFSVLIQRNNPETHWVVFNEVAQSAGLDVIVCLNAAHRIEGTKKWDTRNSLELISFSDSQGYNLTWQLGYEIQGGDDLSGIQFGKDLNRLRTILNAFPRYQHAKLIGPDIRVLHKKEDIDFWNDVLVEAGPTLDAVTWHPRWPQPSKMKVSDNSDLGYEFPADYLEYDKAQLNKILQKSIFKNPVWIGETKRESTGTFAEGLIWARRLVLAAKLGVEVVMKQPNLMDVSHPKPEYWIALLHKRLLGKSVLETRSVTNYTDVSVISHCTNPFYWSDKPEKLQDGPVTIYAVNMGGLEQKIQIKGTWTGKSQLLFQYVLTSGSDPDSVFSQMTYLNGEPLMMTDDGNLPDIIPKIKKIEKGLYMKLPPYSIGFWVVPEAKVKMCQIQPNSIPTINIETLTSSATKSKNLQDIKDINQFLVEKLTNPESESEETPEDKVEIESFESIEKEIKLPRKENNRVARRIRQVKPIDELNQELKTIMQETEEFLMKPETVKNLNSKMKLTKATPMMEHRIQSIAEGISDAIKTTNQEHEFNKFLEDSGLKKDFGSLLMNDRRYNAPGMGGFQPTFFSPPEMRQRLKRSIEESSEEADRPKKFKKIEIVDEDDEKDERMQDIVIPHNPDIKGLEERYKFIVHSKIQDGKRKIDDIKRKIEVTDIKPVPPEKVNDIQEEIIKKEIELLEKTEETVADILESQKKRQENFQDIIIDELKDAKGDRLTALREMYKNQKKKENAIVKRQASTPLTKPLLKTVEYIEKNFNLEPESVRKIKRSLEEKMGEILRNYDTKKAMETKKRMVNPKDERKMLRKPLKELRERRRDQDDERESLEDVRDRVRQKIRKSTLSSSKNKLTRKSETAPRESLLKNRKKYEDDDDDSFELFNQKKYPEIVKKSDRQHETIEEKKGLKKESKIIRKGGRDEEPVTKKPEEKKITEKKPEEKVIEKKSKHVQEPVPLKNDKDRRANMLKEITSLVDHMNSMERNDDRSRRREDDISDEFDTERESRKHNRKPRGVELLEVQPAVVEKMEPGKKMEGVEKAEAATESPVPSTTTRLSKLRRLRPRPSRRMKEKKTANEEKEEETAQKKRHLTGIDRPLLELDRKKFLKPKVKKFIPKALRSENELTGEEKVPEAQPTVDVVEAPKVDEIIQQNEQLKKDLEQIIEEKIFLEEGTENLKEVLGTSGRESSTIKNQEIDFSGETPQPTEGYITVDPTVETDSVEATTVKAVEKNESLEKKEETPEILEAKWDEHLTPKESTQIQDKEKESTEVQAKEDKHSDEVQAKEDAEVQATQESSEVANEANEEKESSEEKRDFSFEDLSQDASSERFVEEPKTLMMEEETADYEDTDNTQRKRRATFLPNFKKQEEPEEDYSSEERIQKFKQMVYKTSPTKKAIKNEVRPSSGIGIGADEFLRMAGSTVRVMFDDVIPEAYGQTKNKIQNMGIPEYIKEFGKIVQQMKNLDQIFLNIGEAAVKGYIRGHRTEKGPYIQVISRKKRSHEDKLTTEDTTRGPTMEETEMRITAVTEPAVATTPRIEGAITPIAEVPPDGSSDYARTSTGETIPSQRGGTRSTGDISGSRSEAGERLPQDFDGRTESPEKVERVEETREKVEMGKVKEFLTDSVDRAITDLEAIGNPLNTLQNQIPNIAKLIPSQIADIDTFQTALKENGKKLNAYMTDDLQGKISPWIKTTKDFIQQALTTLQRQKQLSEILARESINDLMEREMSKKVVDKREVGEEVEPKLPVFHLTPPEPNKKRDVHSKSEDSVIRQLRGLQPGVYVVPTEDMTNIRSEQITNEAKQKPGLPNVVTLNIYYDKKNQDGVEKVETVPQDQGLTQNMVTYYQNKAWNPQYGQGAQYADLVAPVQVPAAYQPNPLYASELPNSRLIQYPAQTYHYPPTAKMYPPIVPNPPSVYAPLYYLPQENRYVAPPPGTKRQWREFRARGASLPGAANSGWNIQYETVPGSVKSTMKALPPTYKNYKLFTDKKRSVGDFKMDPSWSESALPFWKFFQSTPTETQNNKEKTEDKAESGSIENDSAEDIFAENRKRAKQSEKKEKEAKKVDSGEEEEKEEEEEEKSRRRRSVGNDIPLEANSKKMKRSYGYQLDFRDHDVLPGWLGTYQDIENSLDYLPPHVRRSHIVSTPWSDEDEELLQILDADDELALVDLDNDDDYYYSNDNSITHLRRHPRSTDQFDSNTLKSNMIYKMPMDSEHVKPKALGMTGIKNLSDEDSSLELVTKGGSSSSTGSPTKMGGEGVTQGPGEMFVSTDQGQVVKNVTGMGARNPHDDALYYFFKYAYDSFVKVMKSMTGMTGMSGFF